MLKADHSTPLQMKEKIKPPVPLKDSKPKMVPSNHPANKSRDLKEITSLYQMENALKTPPTKPAKPAQLKENAKNPEKQDTNPPPFLDQQIAKKDCRITMVLPRDTLPNTPINKKNIIK